MWPRASQTGVWKGGSLDLTAKLCLPGIITLDRTTSQGEGTRMSIVCSDFL